MKNDSIKLIFKDKRWWFILACTMTIIIVGFKLASLKAYASSFRFDNLRVNECYGYDSATNGEFHFACPNYGGLFFLNNGSTYTFCYVFPASYPLSTLSFSRSIVKSDGTIEVLNYSVATSGSSIVLFTHGGENYKIYFYTFNNTLAFYGVPFYCYEGSLTSALMISGATAYLDQLSNSLKMQGVTIDTSNLEQLISDGNTIAENNATNVATITSDVNDIKQNGLSSSSGLTDDVKLLFKRYDLWLTLIFFCVGLTMFRNVLHQFSKNVRAKK